MDKILIGLYVPSIEEHFDLFVPKDVPAGELAGLLATGLEQSTNGRYRKSGVEMLCVVKPDRLISPQMTLQSIGAENGDRFALF